jgi:hypothetical protein
LTGRPNIDARLENWANVMTDARPRGGVDTPDAWNVERAWQALPQAQRDLLYWCYIKRAVPEVICRKLKISHRPIAGFIERLASAKVSIRQNLEG